MSQNSKAKGEITEAKILAKLVSAGYSVSLPFGNNQRYDLVVDHEDGLLRVQCKTARVVNGSVDFNTQSINGFTGERRSYAGDIDLFLVYCPEIDGHFWVPISELSEKMGSFRMRIHPASNGVSKGIHWASDYAW